MAKSDWVFEVALDQKRIGDVEFSGNWINENKNGQNASIYVKAIIGEEEFFYGWFLAEAVVSCGFKRKNNLLYGYVFDDDEQSF